MIAIKDFLQENSTYNTDQIQSIIRALELSITENYVMWNDQLYKQTSGVAMGTPVAVAYANIFMHWIDEEIRYRAPFIIEHIRYIDDNLFVVPIDKIEELMQITNNILKPQIRFTYETLDISSETGLSFLDTQLFITKEGKIVSRLYSKKTDKHAYLLPSSYHPAHIAKNIPLAVFNRIRRLCSQEDWFQADASKAIGWLEDRDSKYKDIKKAIETSAKKDRWALIQGIEDKRNSKINFSDSNKDVYDILYLVIYGHNTKRIRQVLKQRQNLLDASFIKTKVKPRLTFRRQKNINDILVQKALRGPITSNVDKTFKLCGEILKYRTICPCKGQHNQKICRCCAYTKVELGGIRVKLYKSVDCDSKNIIYMIGYNQYSKKYIGETQQKLKERLLQHLNNITKLKQLLYIHFNTIHAAKDLFITVLETVSSGEAAFRKVREVWWINRLQTLEPRGFNVKLECSQTYVANPNTISIERQEGLSRKGSRR